jgi:hypothetical protein
MRNGTVPDERWYRSGKWKSTNRSGRSNRRKTLPGVLDGPDDPSVTQCDPDSRLEGVMETAASFEARLAP